MTTANDFVGRPPVGESRDGASTMRNSPGRHLEWLAVEIQAHRCSRPPDPEHPIHEFSKAGPVSSRTNASGGQRASMPGTRARVVLDSAARTSECQLSKSSSTSSNRLRLAVQPAFNSEIQWLKGSKRIRHQFYVVDSSAARARNQAGTFHQSDMPAQRLFREAILPADGRSGHRAVRQTRNDVPAMLVRQRGQHGIKRCALTPSAPTPSRFSGVAPESRFAIFHRQHFLVDRFGYGALGMGAYRRGPGDGNANPLILRARAIGLA